MPNIIPIKELRDTTKISERCHDSDDPIFVTKNGYGDMVFLLDFVHINLDNSKPSTLGISARYCCHHDLLFLPYRIPSLQQLQY